MGARIVISEQTLQGIKDPTLYGYRYLDKVQVKGRQNPVHVYEVYGADSEAWQNHKQATRKAFELGLKLYYERNFAEASVEFSQVLRKNERDQAARRYLERCAELMVKGVPEDWQGVFAATEK